MPSFREFKAWITIEGVPVIELSAEASGVLGNTITCWIPSEEGKSFSIHIRDNLVSKPTIIEYFIDGNRCGGAIIRGQAPRSGFIDGFRVNPEHVRPFMFSRVVTTDDDDDAGILGASTGCSQDTGEIKIVIRHAMMLSETARQPQSKLAPSQQTFNEKSKKGIDHQTGFGAPKVRRARFTHARAVGDPIVTFCFKYRPLAMLQANGIASAPAANHADNKKRRRPLSPPKDPAAAATHDIDRDSDSEELTRLEAELEELRRKRSQKRVKVEHESEVKCERSQEGPEVIDLTND
ncbi:hypothetical protein PQX77_010368 [Marasmius sp. AFHP31]|nr:hypothetical protein PQX77_010368 [Marasmius sp. AFHP31]